MTCLAGCRHPRAGELGEVREAYQEMAGRATWPGFAPLEVPLALYDPSGTYLIRHPAPPAAFRRVRGYEDVYAADTVLAELRANTAVRIAGDWTAVVGAPAGPWDAERLAQLLVHEAFHAFQEDRYPDWTANEVDLFTYPVRSAGLLQLRRLEAGALRRAVTAPDSLRELCWAQAFLRARADRFARLPAEAMAYERGSEMREGLAQYMQALAAGTPPALPAEGFPPEQVRQRAYETGHALAVLLDRLAPGWKEKLGPAPGDGLDGQLREAIGAVRARRCGPSPDEVARARTVARADVQALAERDRRERERFETASGWRLEIDAEADPLFPSQFDPLNVRVLDDRHVLQGRLIQVANGSLDIEVLGRPALTRGVGPHPLFNGVDRVWVTGMPEPRVDRRGDTTHVAAEGVRLQVVGVEVTTENTVLRIVLPRPR